MLCGNLLPWSPIIWCCCSYSLKSTFQILSAKNVTHCWKRTVSHTIRSIKPPRFLLSEMWHSLLWARGHVFAFLSKAALLWSYPRTKASAHCSSLLCPEEAQWSHLFSTHAPSWGCVSHPLYDSMCFPENCLFSQVPWVLVSCPGPMS
jgi:hypothetical protein